MDLELFSPPSPPIIIPYLSGAVGGMYVCALIFFNGIRCIGKFSPRQMENDWDMRRAIMKVALVTFVIRREVVECRVLRGRGEGGGLSSHH